MGGFSEKVILIDGKNHLLGRLAALVAKTLLQGHRVTVVRCESLNISGNFFRAKLKYLSFLRKRCNVNPARGPFHHRAPRQIFRRTVRGMLPHKTVRGRQAMKRLRAYEGIPNPWCNKKRVVVPGAMRIMCLKAGRKYCTVGRLSHEVGWKYQDVVKSLEAKRKLQAYKKVREIKHLRRLTRKAGKKVKQMATRYTKVINSYGVI